VKKPINKFTITDVEKPRIKFTITDVEKPRRKIKIYNILKNILYLIDLYNEHYYI